MKIKFHSLAFKTISSLLIFSIFFIFFIIFIVKDVFTSAYMKLETDKVALISKQIVDPLSLNMSYNFTDGINEILNKALINKNVLLIEIKQNTLKDISVFTNTTLSKQEHLDNNELSCSSKLYDPATQEKIGEMIILYSKNSFESYMKEFNQWFFSGVFIFALSMLMLSYYLYRSLNNLKILDDSLKNFDPNHPKRLNLNTNKKDEISSISKSANEMIENIIKFILTSKELNTSLFQSEEHLKDAQKMAKVGSLNYNLSKNSLKLSDEYHRLLKISTTDTINWKDFLSYISEDDYPKVEKVFQEALLNITDFDIEYTLRFSDENYIHLRTKGSVSQEEKETTLTAISMDITLDVENKKIIEKLAFFDPLTGLANRTLLKDRIKKSIQEAKRNDKKIGILFLDLDHFKLINDTLGHSVGDDLLVHISKLLKKQIRESDTLARLGGDEFVILLPSIQDDNDAKEIASKILHVLQEKHTIGSHQLYITSSIGVATYPEHGENCDELIRSADTAMYEAKNSGRNKYEFFLPSMGNFIDKQLHLEQDLIEAVKSKKQIEIYYQAKVDATTKAIIGAEALVRWNHPTRGLVFPDDFIYMAESTGLMIELGNVIIEDSIANINTFNNLNSQKFNMAINLSERQFQDSNLVFFVESMIKKYNVNPNSIEFEITETLSMTNMSHTFKILQDLKKLGVSIAIDDFGTGHSSLSYLKKFPIDILKIDKSFVMGITTSDEDAIITQTIITMAHSLGLKTVAEGVETLAHAQSLKNMGCDILQGYYYSKPISKSAFILFLKNYKYN